MNSILGSLRLLLRSAGLVLVVLWGVLIGLYLLALRLINVRLRDRALHRVARHWFRCVVRVMGVHQDVQGRPVPGAALVVANHVSWLDIAVLGSHVGAGFVSKSEVARWPVVGWLAREGGTLFIHRGKHDSAEHIAHDMTARLASGGRVLLFPEGTTSDGTEVRRFKNRLFQPALHANVPVQPVALRYHRGHDRVDPVVYIEGVTLVGSALGVLRRRRTEVSLAWCKPVELGGRERRDIAADAERRVVAAHASLRREERREL